MTKKTIKKVCIALVVLVVIGIIMFFLSARKNNIEDIDTEKGVISAAGSKNSSLNESQKGDSDAVLGTSEAIEESSRAEKHTKLQIADSIGGVAMKLYDKYKILPSAVVAEAMFQTCFGVTDVTDINNYFYLPYQKGCGAEYKVYSYGGESDEKDDGDNEKYTVAYRKYSSIEEGVQDYEKYIETKYPEIKGITDYEKACEILDKDNVDELVSIIEQHQFNQRYDAAINKEK